MNAQTNFQQFVNANKGKLITFKHNDKTVSRFVVDVCSEYFTGKINESDAKIDGFYYFSDCKVHEAVIDVLEKHVVVVLKTIGGDFVFQYTGLNNDGLVSGKNLNTNNILSFTRPETINEVWAVATGKFQQVYSKEPSQSPLNNLSSYFETQNKVLNNCEKVINTIDNLNKAFDKVFSKESSIKEQTNDELTDKDKDIIDILKNNKYVTVKTKTKVWVNFIFNSIEGRFVLGDCDRTPTAIPLNNIIAVEASQEPFDIDQEQYKLIKEHAKMFIDISYDLGGYAPETINKFLNKLLFIKERDFSLEVLQEFRVIFEELRNELIPQIKNLFKTDPTFQALLKRFVEFSLLVLRENSPNKDNVENLLKIINKNMTEAGRKEYNKWFKNGSQKNIKYRGKPKTVEIVNEYTLDNGKEYIMVKDINDNNKTKTLFKEYIEWL